jgi:16S rRNA (adenine1518-N6/adenine1519-N6)-dimethyltransferase
MSRPRNRGRRASPPQLPPYLERLGVQPRKALGQNFLIDELALGDIATAAAASGVATVLEIGAGPGGLTEELLAHFGTVVAVEIDEELAELTRRRLSAHEGLTVVAADILDFTPVDLLEEAGAGGPYVVAGNLPYYITQPIVRRLLEADPGPERIVVMVQREVARRMVGAGGRESLLSMSIKFYGAPQALFDVPSSSFWPAPKVDSAVVAIDRLTAPPIAVTAAERSPFFHLLRAGYASPRKQLHNALPAALGLPGDAVTAALEVAGIDPALRAQHLGLVEWESLFRAVEAAHPEALVVPEPVVSGRPVSDA